MEILHPVVSVDDLNMRPSLPPSIFIFILKEMGAFCGLEASWHVGKEPKSLRSDLRTAATLEVYLLSGLFYIWESKRWFNWFQFLYTVCVSDPFLYCCMSYNPSHPLMPLIICQYVSLFIFLSLLCKHRLQWADTSAAEPFLTSRVLNWKFFPSW